MRDQFLDLVGHTYDLGCVDLIKVEGTDTNTVVDGIASDRSVIVHGEFKDAIPEFEGVFGLPSLSNLKTLLNLEVYREDAKLSVKSDAQKGPTSLLFENKDGDFKNEYRFMIKEVVEQQLKTAKFKGATWNLEIVPAAASILRLKYQAQANPEESTFQAKTVKGDLIFYFGDHSTSNGEFVFQHEVDGELKKKWHWPIAHIISILSLPGDKTYRISDQGATEIVVDSGLAVYTYILPAQTK